MSSVTGSSTAREARRSRLSRRERRGPRALGPGSPALPSAQATTPGLARRRRTSHRRHAASGAYRARPAGGWQPVRPGASGRTALAGRRGHPPSDYDARVVTVVAHPLAEHLLTQLRDRDTPPPVFRTLAKRLALAITLEAIRDLPTDEVKIETPLEPTTGRVLAETLVAVPILRAGLGMLEAVTKLFPEVAVGYIGLERDEASLLPQSYYRKLPQVADRHVLVLDPMLATGGSGAAATCGS